MIGLDPGIELSIPTKSWSSYFSLAKLYVSARNEHSIRSKVTETNKESSNLVLELTQQSMILVI